MEPNELLREGRVSEALKELQDGVRKNPSDSKLRVFLFQLLSVLGDWERAMTQLNVAAELDPNVLLMAQVCRPALNCEALRSEIFAGKRAPLVFGEPEEWVGWMIQASQLAAEGHYGPSRELRARALEAAPATEGRINGQPFEWIMDSDSRLGPILEAIVDARYFWVPFNKIRNVVIEEPTDLRDLVWVPAHFIWTNGGGAIGLIPTRYPGSEKSGDGSILLARKTDWDAREGDLYVGLGQRMLATDQAEYALLETRTIEFGSEAEAEEPAAEEPPPAPPEGPEHA